MKQFWFIFHTLHCFRRKAGKKKWRNLQKQRLMRTLWRFWWPFVSGWKIKIFPSPQAVWTGTCGFLWWSWKAASCLFIIVFCVRTLVCPDPGSSCSSLGFFFFLIMVFILEYLKHVGKILMWVQLSKHLERNNFLAHFEPPLFYGKDWIFSASPLFTQFNLSLHSPPCRSEIFYSHFKLQLHHSDSQSLTEMGIRLHFTPSPVPRFGVVSSPPEIKSSSSHYPFPRICAFIWAWKCANGFCPSHWQHRKLYELPPFIPPAKAPTVCFISGYCILTNYP